MARPSTMVPSVKILALKVNFGALEEVKMLASFLRCFPNVETLHIASVIAADGPTRKHNGKFWRELRPIKCLKSQVKKMFVHEFRGDRSKIEFLKFAARSAEKLGALLVGVTKEIFASALKVNEAAAKVAAVSRRAWACDRRFVLVVGPRVANVWSFRKASDLYVKDPFH
ncbi:hypothetical protein ACQ4PT_022579 [Festuca glaucescens]